MRIFVPVAKSRSLSNQKSGSRASTTRPLVRRKTPHESVVFAPVRQVSLVIGPDGQDVSTTLAFNESIWSDGATRLNASLQEGGGWRRRRPSPRGAAKVADSTRRPTRVSYAGIVLIVYDENQNAVHKIEDTDCFTAWRGAHSHQCLLYSGGWTFAVERNRATQPAVLRRRPNGLCTRRGAPNGATRGSRGLNS